MLEKNKSEGRQQLIPYLNLNFPSLHNIYYRK